MAEPDAIYALTVGLPTGALSAETEPDQLEIQSIARIPFAFQSIQCAPIRRYITTPDNCYQASQISTLES